MCIPCVTKVVLIILLKLIVIVKLPLLPHGISLINPKKKKKNGYALATGFWFSQDTYRT